MLVSSDKLFETLRSINDVHVAAYRAGQENCTNCKRLERENKELKQHIYHLEESLAAALGDKVGVRVP